MRILRYPLLRKAYSQFHPVDSVHRIPYFRASYPTSKNTFIQQAPASRICIDVLPTLEGLLILKGSSMLDPTTDQEPTSLLEYPSWASNAQEAF